MRTSVISYARCRLSIGDYMRFGFCPWIYRLEAELDLLSCGDFSGYWKWLPRQVVPSAECNESTEWDQAWNISSDHFMVLVREAKLDDLSILFAIRSLFHRRQALPAEMRGWRRRVASIGYDEFWVAAFNFVSGSCWSGGNSSWSLLRPLTLAGWHRHPTSVVVICSRCK